jgi:hypothetical protein
MTDANPTLRQALAYAARGWPVFPCHPGEKVPATRHGYRDATTDPGQITAWFTGRPGANLAIATGHPGPDVLDIDHHGPAGNGYPAYYRLLEAGLADDPAACICTPSGGMHAYYAGTDQHCGHLPGHHLDFRSAGGYVLAPPSRINGYPYVLIRSPGGHGHLDWAAATRLLQPDRQPGRPQPGPAPGRDLGHLARWVAAQPEGNRNAGLTDLEITRTLNSARWTGQPRREPPDHQAEAED